MEEELEAVRLMLESVMSEGREWYRRAKVSEVETLQSRISGNFSIFKTHEHHLLTRKPIGSLPSKKVLVMPPSRNEAEEVVGLWLRWDFTANPYAFRLFVGHWAKVDGVKTFVAFRFEAPEIGERHNYFHCQPCRNFGDKENVLNAALVSDHFPTIPVNASNIVELTVCALMSCMGHNQARSFLRRLLQSSASGNGPLNVAFARCCH